MKPLIEKYRYSVKYEKLVWEIDEFTGANSGLVLAEVELDSTEQKIQIPKWIGTEVTGDPKYYNANMVNNPYQNWKK
jgi:CYTH domain-containing protein